MASTRHLLSPVVGSGDRTGFGPVLTQRYVAEGNALVPAGTSQNAGIACYVCEAICGQWHAAPENGAQLGAAARLIDQILDQAVAIDSETLWRWEKVPRRSDYLYPPDWDDTCKAVDAIKSFEFATGGHAAIQGPSAEWVGRALCASMFEADTLGEDAVFRCENRLALHMFITSRQEKANNKEDLMVTAVTLRSILRHYPSVVIELTDVLRSLFFRLVEAADLGLRNSVCLSEISRCYFSWGHYLLALVDISRLTGWVSATTMGLIKHYLTSNAFEELLPQELRDHLIQDERRYACILASQAGVRSLAPSWELLRTPDETSPQVMFQHRRLKHCYGSSAWSDVLYDAARRSLEKWA